ncbi:MAG: thermonuclease family protein [Acidobacteria bacterium]|nr:thermonuclease family protein [Acidobacteriota bacterium]
MKAIALALLLLHPGCARTSSAPIVPGPAAPSQAPVADFTGKVVAVADGDTITVLRGREQIRVRLYGVDAPEDGDPYSRVAKRTTSDLVSGRTIRVDPVDTDRYGRVVARVTTDDGRDLGQELVRSGLAWWYRRYADDDGELTRLEAEARSARRGLWADPNPVPPWEARAARREEQARPAHQLGEDLVRRCLLAGVLHRLERFDEHNEQTGKRNLLGRAGVSLREEFRDTGECPVVLLLGLDGERKLPSKKAPGPGRVSDAQDTSESSGTRRRRGRLHTRDR